jgi:hypothetical protein
MFQTSRTVVSHSNKAIFPQPPGANEDFGSEVIGQMWLIFVQAPTTNPTQHDPHGPDDPFRTVNYHHLDIRGHDGMDEQEIG